MLTKILETKKEEIASLTIPDPYQGERRSLKAYLTRRGSQAHVIAEVKKASPSKGVIREDFNPLEIALSYESGGADAISVLTDVTYFQGNREYLTEIKKHVKIPVLRKDFIVDPLQVEESEALGADAILLIAAALEPEKLKELYDLAYNKGMECLVEVHSSQELEELMNVFTPEIIGVNNRDLSTFVTSLEVTEKTGSLIPAESVFVSESGIHEPKDLERVAKAGANAVLVGESLMRQRDPGEAVKRLKGETLHDED
ncbi:indole-3-glycerol phosphate synthase TrpC [Thalassorhabdus alkalitolerans]|uniref:Indole-3-glycerol phosphate synthase n=1 Tax=Thalassorhabdus alkalitolerans TaxID=2282697 RepID=A0ABW0YRW9_9BACI